MYQIVKHLHSISRWILLAFLIASVIIALIAVIRKKERFVSLYKATFITTHIQLLLGFVLYIISPLVMINANTMSNHVIRFYTLEHALGMIVAIVLISVAYIKFKKNPNTILAHKKIFWWYLIALIIIIVSIPWPFMSLGGKWM